MRIIPFLLFTGCTVGLVNETKPISQDTGIMDTASADTDTDTDTDTNTDNQSDYENPYNGECSDGIDNDGDGRTDCDDTDCSTAPECTSSPNGDTDGDGYPDDQDCNPYNPYVNPGAQELPNNGIDDNCNGTVDEGSGGGTDSGGTDSGGTDSGGGSTGTSSCNDSCTDGFGNVVYGANNGSCEDGGFGDFFALAIGSSLCGFGTDCTDCGPRVDADGDLHEDDPLNLGLSLYSDCDDSDPTINSSAYDTPNDGIDQDCDGSDAGTTTTPTENCTDGIDNDGDGLTDCNDTDCATDPACNTGNSCCYTLNMSDSYGDGWNGASVTATENGSTIGSYTFASGSSGSASICVTDGSSLALDWTAGGYDYECSFDLVHPDGTTVHSETYPSSGALYSETVNCSASGGGSSGGTGGSCIYSVEMTCGYDGWGPVWLRSYVNGSYNSLHYPSTSDCSSDPTFTKTDTITINSGETLELDLEDTSSTPSDVEVYVSGAMTGYYNGSTNTSQNASGDWIWSLSHTCP